MKSFDEVYPEGNSTMNGSEWVKEKCEICKGEGCAECDFDGWNLVTR